MLKEDDLLRAKRAQKHSRVTAVGTFSGTFWREAGEIKMKTTTTTTHFLQLLFGRFYQLCVDASCYVVTPSKNFV